MNAYLFRGSLAGGALEAFTAWLSYIAGTNWWNPVGWAAAAALAVGVVVVAVFLYDYFLDEHPEYADEVQPETKSVVVQEEGTETEEVTSKDPPTEKDGYIAPKGGPRRGRTNDGKNGWVDKNGNIWVPVPTGSPAVHGGGHWDVQSPHGKGYSNVYPGGHVRPGTGIPPKIGKPVMMPY